MSLLNIHVMVIVGILITYIIFSIVRTALIRTFLHKIQSDIEVGEGKK